MRDIKKLYQIYKEEKTESDRLDTLWEQDPENEILEAAWDDAYTRYHNRAWELAEAIEIFTHGKVNKTVAMQIIDKKPQELAALIERIA